MKTIRTSACLAAVALALAACNAEPASRPAINYGQSQEQQLRAVQLQGATSGTNPGFQNPQVTGRSSLDEMQRQGTGGAGSAAAPIVPGTARIQGGGAGDADIQRRGAGAPR